MMKIFPIISVSAAIAAGAFIVIFGFYGGRSDGQSQAFVNSPGVIEKFRGDGAGGSKGRRDKDQISPLVEQAKGFGLYLNPPPKPKPKQARPSPTLGRPRPVAQKPDEPVSAKFELVATSYYAGRPELSLALLDMPGKGLRWVRQSGGVGHLVLEQVKDGFVVVRDGQRTFEVVAERQPRRSLLKGAASAPEKTKPVLSVSDKAGTSATPQEAARLRPDKTRALMEKFVSELGAARKRAESGGADLAERGDAGASLMEKLISQFEAMRVGQEEAEKLDDLGKRLKDMPRDPNQDKSGKVGSSKK
jgi:hypothetical protein